MELRSQFRQASHPQHGWNYDGQVRVPQEWNSTLRDSNRTRWVDTIQSASMWHIPGDRIECHFPPLVAKITIVRGKREVLPKNSIQNIQPWAYRCWKVTRPEIQKAGQLDMNDLRDTETNVLCISLERDWLDWFVLIETDETKSYFLSAEVNPSLSSISRQSVLNGGTTIHSVSILEAKEGGRYQYSRYLATHEEGQYYTGVRISS